MRNFDERILERIHGASWDTMRDLFLQVSGDILSVGESARADLTTIYVKFSVDSTPNSPVFAVAWLKSAKNIVFGLSLPDDFESFILLDAPSGMKYKGLTKYFRLDSEEFTQIDLIGLATLAFTNASKVR
jgi:hypothetical protein